MAIAVNLDVYFCLIKVSYGLPGISYSVDKLIGPPHNFFLISKLFYKQIWTNLIETFV